MNTNPTTNRSPIHTLGQDLTGITTRDGILTAMEANWEAIQATPASTFVGEDGLPVSVPLPAIALHRSDNLAPVGVHTESYGAVQHGTMIDTALEIVGLTHGDGKITAGGVLPSGKLATGAMAFVVVDLGTITLDPLGVNDQIVSQLIGWNSHNGKLPVMFTPDSLRVICSNVLPQVRESVRERGFLARHTKGVLDKLKLAKAALGIHEAARAQFIAQAETMLHTPANHDTVNRTIEALWPSKPTDSDNTKTRAASRSAAIHRLFDSPTNAPAVGENLWSVYNSVTEYLDHSRGTSVEKRALASIIPGGHVEHKKQEAARYLLSQ